MIVADARIKPAGHMVAETSGKSLKRLAKGLGQWFEIQKKLEGKIMKNEVHGSGPASAVYGLGFIGAAIYYISTATTFWTGVLGFLKAVVWPAFLVYEALKALGM